MANQPTKYRKFVVGAASAALVASAVAPVASAKDFSDTKGNTHEVAIDALSDVGIISGYQDGTFKPNKTLTRSDVVKLMGKWLVSEGYEVPSDYKTNPRFTDLTSATNDELLKYAAVVKDNGVFNGSNGRLLAGDNITRENMAVVLVRAFDTVKEIDLVQYVEGQADFKKEVTDRNAAKAEARPAIDVLDFFDITTVATFNPKDTTTRGHFASFLHRALNTDFSAVTGVVSGVESITAVNNTTVEVKFVEKVEDLAAWNFKIDGLEIKNKVVKQTSDKTVVLTTDVQEGGKVYTVTANDNKIGSFTGVSAVVPTSVKLVDQSIQGILGQEVTVKAQVEVPEGQSKAGIPVTFNVPSTGSLVPAITAEAITDENGVAQYSFTRYAATDDAVTAYATGDRSKFSTGYVFWGVKTSLVIEEVTEGNTINNGSNKTYKVTYLNRVTGNPVANAQLNVSFKENINVSVDKASNATVNGTNPVQLANGSATDSVEIFTDSKGVATFTVSGVNTEVTPVVWVPTVPQTNAANYSEAYSASLLQTSAKTVKFSAVQAEYTIELTRDGGETAATGLANGRKYKILVKDKDGNPAKHEIVNLAFNENLDRVISTNTNAEFIDVASNGTHIGWLGQSHEVKTNEKGEASFVIGSTDTTNRDYATPLAWIDINSSNAKDGQFDQGEPHTIGAVSYFTAPVLTAGSVTSYLGSSEEDAFTGLETATFAFYLTNQSGKEITLAETNYDEVEVTYTIRNTGANNIVVEEGTTREKIVSPNRSTTVTVKANGSIPSITVDSIDNKTTSVSVTASAIAYDKVGNTNDRPFTIATTSAATATFTSTTAVGTEYTGVVEAISASGLKFNGKNTEAFTSTTKFFGINGNEIIGAQNFVDEVLRLGGTTNEVKVTMIKDKDGNKTFKIVSATTGTPPVNNALVAAKDALKAAIDSVNVNDYTTGDQASVTAALNTANAALASTSDSVTFFTNARTALQNTLATLTKKSAAVYNISPATGVVSTGVSTSPDTLTFTFNAVDASGNAIAGFDFDTTNLVAASTTASSTHRAKVTNGSAGQLVLTVNDGGFSDAPVDLNTIKTDKFVFDATVESTNHLSVAVTVTVSHNGTNWVATVVKK